MKIPLSWIRDFVQIEIPLPHLCHLLTMAGLEVEALTLVGLIMPETAGQGMPHHELKIDGLSWEADKIVVGAVHEVMPHPNADRLVLCRLDDGQREHIVLTGTPNLYPYKGQGALDQPLKVPYARQGARIYDGHQPGRVLTTLKPAKIRGVESYSMICSEKELGISDEHEGVIILDGDAPVGVPLAHYMGDAVLDIAITPNIARAANMLGVAREVSALTGQQLHPPSYDFWAEGPTIEGLVSIEIRQPELNPRFVLGLIRNVTIQPSPYWVQRRLRLAGMRPINNIVDATNYAMLEVGQPLHAFDYDILVQRAGGKPPTIITRTAHPGESLTTLDGEEHDLDDFTVLVCDSAGALSIGGVMGGAESEVHGGTRNVLLEGAAWDYINIRRTLASQRMTSEAGYRFSRGVHPAMTVRGVSRCLELMRQWSAVHGSPGAIICRGLVDEYPLPRQDPQVEVTPAGVRRWLGIDLAAADIAELLQRLEFEVQVKRDALQVTAPDHRLDIGQGITGQADVMEELARVYGYERIPETRMADELPPPHANISLELEERARDLLVELGLQEIAAYRLTSPEREARRLPLGWPPDDLPYVRLANPIASDRVVLRHSLLSGLLEVIERNVRLADRLALFEIGPVYLLSEEEDLPDEQLRLAIALTGRREPQSWKTADASPLDFYDLKGLLEALCEGLHLSKVRFEPGQHPSFHPGKCAQVFLAERLVGTLGELHPLVQARYDLLESPVLAADLDLGVLLAAVPTLYEMQPVSTFPPVLEDLAVIVDEAIPAGSVEEVIRQAAGQALASLRLFDVYRGQQAGPGKKSLAYSLSFQAPDRTLTDGQAAEVRGRILRRLEQELGAKLRS